MPKIKDIKNLPDIQSNVEGFPKKAIKKVGIRDIRVPIKVLRKDGSINETTSEVSIYSNLTSKVKGANMSRYRILVEEYLINKNLNLREYLRELLKATREKLDATDSYVKIKFDYFLINDAPASHIKSYIDYKCCIEGKQQVIDDKVIDKFYLIVKVPYTSLCPCSKEISDYGAHNQRSYATVTVELIEDKITWIEDLVRCIEGCASAPIINGLKRVDEAFQTELMYENPRFVEDMVRQISEKFDKTFLDKTIKDYSIICEHIESIHTHTAVAVITAGRNLQ